MDLLFKIKVVRLIYKKKNKNNICQSEIRHKCKGFSTSMTGRLRYIIKYSYTWNKIIIIIIIVIKQYLISTKCNL
jgi:hypothetical protein